MITEIEVTYSCGHIKVHYLNTTFPESRIKTEVECRQCQLKNLEYGT